MTDFYIPVSTDLLGYQCDQTSIIKKKYLKYLSRVKYEEEEHNPPPQVIDWYPFTNSYYPYTEDVDAFGRVNHLLGSKPSFESLTSIENDSHSLCGGDAFTEKQAQLQYLSSNPVSFLILGKPEVGQQELGKLLADYWQCVYIDPELLIEEEILSGSRAGQCIEFNLRSGRAVGVDVILRLVEKRAKSKSAQHRGFVICGFPLIPNDLYEEDPVSSESAVFNVKEIFEEVFETTIEIGVPPPDLPQKSSKFPEEAPGEAGDELRSEAPPSEKTVTLPAQNEVPLDMGSVTMSNICGPGDLERNFEEQINFIFGLFERPFVIIYVMCNNSDVVSKHSDYRFDYFSKQLIDLQGEYNDKIVYTLFSREPHLASDEMLDDFIDVVKNTKPFDIPAVRQLVRLPRDFPSNVVTLLDRYRYSALPVIERHVLLHDVQYFIKVDGRISALRMFNAVKMKLRVLPLQKVILPQKLLVPEEGGEGGPTDDIDVDELTPDECFQIFRKRQIASPMFKWTWSDWGLKCPVSMKEGDFKDGNPKYAVHFMNKIFFLSGEDAYVKFYRNPRPYLLPPYPKPSCRMTVMGPRCSGKSAVSRCLGYLLNGEVLDFNGLRTQFIKHKEEEYLDQIRSNALTEGIFVLNERRRNEWLQLELERQANVEKWVAQQIELLEETIRLTGEMDRAEESAADNVPIVLDVSSFPVQLSYNTKSRSVQLNEQNASLTEAEKLKLTVAELQALIEENGLPCFDNIGLCQQLVANPDMLMDYLPPGLHFHEYIEESATVFDDFVKEYAENAVKNAVVDDIKLSPEELTGMLIDTITDVENRSVESGNNKGGWILDGLPADEELLQMLLPRCFGDDVFLLKDSEDHQFLLDRFETKGLNQFWDFRQFFMGIENADAAWRSPSIKSTASYKTCMAKFILQDVVNEAVYTSDNKEEAGEDKREIDPYYKKHPRRTEVEAYEKELQTFDEDWSKIKDLLTPDIVTVAEISVTGKSLPTLLKEVVKNVEDRFRQLASVFTAEEREEELQDFGEPEMQGEDMGEGEEKDAGEDTFFQNRRYGDTSIYCPVALHDHWVLWKGKEEFTAKFENKLYLMSSEDALNAFMSEPRNYLRDETPQKWFPPPRVCIVGPKGSGKTTVSKLLGKNLGLFHVDYINTIKNTIALRSKFELSEILKMGITGETGEMLKNYMASDQPLTKDFLDKIVLPQWSEEPVRTFGLVFDGFPMRPSDVEYIIQSCTIPDIVIEMTVNQGEIHRRMVEKFEADWEATQNEKKKTEEEKRKEIMGTWRERRRNRFMELMDLKREERYTAKIKDKGEGGDEEEKPVRPYMEDLMEVDEETDVSSPNTKSQVSYDSIAEEADRVEVSQILDREMPEPILEEEPEMSLEEALESFIAELEDSFVSDLDFIRLAREQCEAQLIPWITVDAGMDEDKVFAQVTRIVDKYKFRNGSLYERVYDISVELAEKLLSSGYYFLGRFGRTCPVQVYENANPVQMFLPLEQQFQLFPVIHRQYIYFTARKENRDKFKADVLKYVLHTKAEFPLIPLKLAIVGPPKSGKSTLADRFKRELGLKVISPGQAGRYVLNYLKFSELTRNMESVLHLGWELTSEMMVKCVEAMAFDGKSITQGFVFDGFPTCNAEVRHLAEVGLVPQLVIDLQADQAEVQEFLAGDVGKRNVPRFSQKFVDHRYNEWFQGARPFREWLDEEYQIIGKVPVKPSKWGVWSASYNLATAALYEIKHYYKYCCSDRALRLANMQVTPLEFVERQSSYKHYCPCCLHYDYFLVNGDTPPDRTGLVQFRKHYYYLCPRHINEFIDDPEQFLSPYNRHNMPEDLPKRTFMMEIPDDVYENGVCIVCYWENRPRRILKKGNIHFSVVYKERTYMFDHLSCMNKFMREPHKYYAKSINFKGTPYPPLDYDRLPVVGFLEQYDAKQVTRAVSNTGILRPIIPGLSPAVSAAINIALCLKLNNPKTPRQFIPLYEEARKKYHESRLNLINYVAQMKRMINPYLYYDEPMPKFVDPLLPPTPPLSIRTAESELECEFESDVYISGRMMPFRSLSESDYPYHESLVSFDADYRSDAIRKLHESEEDGFGETAEFTRTDEPIDFDFDRTDAAVGFNFTLTEDRDEACERPGMPKHEASVRSVTFKDH